MNHSVFILTNNALHANFNAELDFIIYRVVVIVYE